MRRRLVFMALVTGLVAGTGAAASASGGHIDVVRDFDTVVAVAPIDGPPIDALMRADCSYVKRIVQPDGGAREIQKCTLSVEPVMVEEFQGVPPSSAFIDAGGECIWTSDYFWVTEDRPVFAASFRATVTPSGNVTLTATYPPGELDCAGED